MKFARRLTQKRWVQKTIGVAAAEYLRLVWMTSRFTMEPEDPYRLYGREQPVILAMWHGQHFMLPFLRRGFPFRVLISRHIDGEINAIAAEWLGVGTVRGSGDHGRRYHVKGGVGAFKSMMDALAEGCNMVLTADVPKVSRGMTSSPHGPYGLGYTRPGSASSSSRARRDGRSFQLRSPPAAARCSTTGTARPSTFLSAAAQPLSVTRSACRPKPALRRSNKRAARSSKRSMRRPSAPTQSPPGLIAMRATAASIN
jgi:hypothetical protein